jgi:hypothetical protein
MELSEMVLFERENVVREGRTRGEAHKSSDRN